jgi:hypothetical protein
MTETPADADSRAGSDDIEALREQLHDLRRRNQELEATRSLGRRVRTALRATAVVLLIALGGVCITASVPAIWGRNLVLNTDRYVETLKPLANDPGVQQAIVKAVDQQFAANVDIGATLNEALPPRAAAVLSGPLQTAASSLVDTVATRFVKSKFFAALWEQMNRVAHTGLVAILEGKGDRSGALSISNGILYLNLAPVVTAIKARLVQAGLAVAANVPAVGATIAIMKVEGLTKAQSAVRTLDRTAHWLPALALLCFTGGVLTSRRRRRAVITSALVTAGGMMLIAAGVLIGRRIYLDSLPLKYLTADDAGRVFDTVVRFLRDGLRLVFVVAILLSVLMWLTGRSRQAQSTRRWIGDRARAITSRGSESRYAGVIAANRRIVSIAICAVAALVLVLWTNPGLAMVLTITLIAAALIVLVYSIAPPTHTPPP